MHALTKHQHKNVSQLNTMPPPSVPGIILALNTYLLDGMHNMKAKAGKLLSWLGMCHR